MRQQSLKSQELKRQLTWKNNYFARYMLLRYTLALFFFANVYWLAVLSYQGHWLGVVPLTMLIAHALGSVEQFKLYGKREARLAVTKRAFQAQLAVCLGVVLSCISPIFSTIFPVFADNLTGRGFVIGLQLLGCLILVLNLRRIRQILDNKDKFYHRFQHHIEKYI